VKTWKAHYKLWLRQYPLFCLIT